MEASENRQIPLDASPDDPAGAVRVLDDRLVVERLTVTDERVARVVRERAESGQPPARTVTRAVEIGARVLDSEETAVNVDYVRAEFERHAASLRERLTRALEQGDQQLAERIAQSFDAGRDGSVPKEIEARVEEALADQRDALLKLFSAQEGSNPLFDFKDAMVKVFRELGSRQQQEGEENRKVIAELRRELVELKERTLGEERVAEAEDAGTRKGRGFEDRAHEAIERIAASRGDCATHTGGEQAEGPSAGRIVFEAKDKKLSKNQAWAELNEGMAARAAGYAVLVVAGEDRVPAGREQLHEYEGNKLIVAVDRDEPDGLALETAYRLAAARVRLAQEVELKVDGAAVRAAAAEAVSLLKQAQAIRSQLTGIKTSSDKARAGLDGMVAAVQAKLDRIDSLVADAGEPA